MQRQSGCLQRRWRSFTGGVILACGPMACGPAPADGPTLSAATGGSAAPASGQGSATADPVLPHPADLATRVSAVYDPEVLREHARAIVEHERPSGSEGENAAIDYVVSTLTEAGVPVEVHEFDAFVSTPISASVRVLGSDYSPVAIGIAYSAPVDSLVAEVVDVGTLADLPGLEYGTGEQLAVMGMTVASATSNPREFPDVSGKIALVTGQPRSAPTAVLEALGAAGVIFVNPEERVNDLIVTSTWGSPSLRNYHRLPKVPVAHIARSDGDRLRSMLEEGPLQLQLDVEVDTGWRTLRLVMARVDPESRPDAPYVLLGGHIDAWYHGATDEGASNAAMVALAQAFHHNRASIARGLVVAWWPGHSNGRYAGSTWFADHYASELRTRALAYVNVDGIGQRGATRFGAATTASLAGLARSVVVDGAGLPIDPGRPGTHSDQSFNGVGLPLLQLYHNRSEEDRGTWWWHTPEDTFDKIDFEVLKGDTDLYASALSALLVAPVLPLDLVAQAEAAGAALAMRASESDGRLDLSSARAAHVQLSRAFAELQALAASESAADMPDLDLALVAVLRPLHRILYVAGSPHHPDAGRDPGPLPGLWPARILAEEEAGSDRFGFASTTLIREANRVVEALVEATDRAEALSRQIKDMDGDE